MAVRVVIESPYSGPPWRRWRNRRYARACLRDALMRDEAPIASHLLYTQGIAAGHAWSILADLVAVYTDYGISPDMDAGIQVARSAIIPIEYRRLYS